MIDTLQFRLATPTRTTAASLPFEPKKHYPKVGISHP
jgi:hypothetical protein